MSATVTEAVPIRHLAYGDSDLLVTLFTRSEGKRTCMAKAARKSRKRFGGSLELFSLIRVVYSRRTRGGGMPLLSESSVVDPYENIRTNVMATALAGFWCEIVYVFAEEGEPSESLFALLSGMLGRLHGEPGDSSRLNVVFLMRFLRQAGLSPMLSGCVRCRGPVAGTGAEQLFFDTAAGGIVCGACAVGPGPGVRVFPGTVKVLSWAGQEDLEKALRVRFSGESLAQGTRLLEGFVRHHLGRNLKSLEFLRQVRR